MVPVICLFGSSESYRIALIKELALRGYQVGLMSSGPDTDGAGCAEGTVAPYLRAGVACVGKTTAEGLSVFYPARALREQRTNLFSSCHIVLTESSPSEDDDIIEIVRPGRQPRYASHPRLRAVVGKKVNGAEIPVLEPDNPAALCSFIEERYLKPQLSGAVLAGGKSRRLGSNKALLEIHGVKLIEHVLKTLKLFTQQVRIIANEPEPYAGLGVPVSPDIKPGGGPLSGIHAALSLSPTDYVLVASCDLPLLDKACIEPLVSHYPGYDITLYKHERFEPLCAIYRRSCIPALEELISHGEYRIIDLFPTLSVKVIRTDNATAFKNINTWEDYEAVLRKGKVLSREY